MAITIRRLTDEEAVTAFPKRGQIDLRDYEDALRDVEAGAAFEIDVNGALSVRALKRRLGQAVKRTHGGTAHLKYNKVLDTAEGQVLQFKVIGHAQPSARRRTRTRREV